MRSDRAPLGLKIAAGAGYDFGELCELILERAALGVGHAEDQAEEQVEEAVLATVGVPARD